MALKDHTLAQVKTRKITIWSLKTITNIFVCGSIQVTRANTIKSIAKRTGTIITHISNHSPMSMICCRDRTSWTQMSTLICSSSQRRSLMLTTSSINGGRTSGGVSLEFHGWSGFGTLCGSQLTLRSTPTRTPLELIHQCTRTLLPKWLCKKTGPSIIYGRESSNGMTCSLSKGGLIGSTISFPFSPNFTLFNSLVECSLKTGIGSLQKTTTTSIWIRLSKRKRSSIHLTIPTS